MARPHSEHIHRDDVVPGAPPAAGWPAGLTARVRSRDAESGDIRLGNSGLMAKGCYFWRPPYIAHGPFFSTAGMLALITVDSPLINHFVDDPWRTIEENRAEALARGGPADYLGELAQ